MWDDTAIETLTPGYEFMFIWTEEELEGSLGSKIEWYDPYSNTDVDIDIAGSLATA